MCHTFVKHYSKAEFTQNSRGDYDIRHSTYLKATNNWMTFTTRGVDMIEAQEMMSRLERKGYAYSRR